MKYVHSRSFHTWHVSSKVLLLHAATRGRSVFRFRRNALNLPLIYKEQHPVVTFLELAELLNSGRHESPPAKATQVFYVCCENLALSAVARPHFYSIFLMSDHAGKSSGNASEC